MPEVTGFDVLERIAEMGARVPVVTITGHDLPDAEECAMRGGAAAYLRKPVNQRLLLAAIAAAMAEARQEKVHEWQGEERQKDAPNDTARHECGKSKTAEGLITPGLRRPRLPVSRHARQSNANRAAPAARFLVSLTKSRSNPSRFENFTRILSFGPQAVTLPNPRVQNMQ